MLRDIKQVYKPDAPMVMLRSIKWGGKDYHPGDPIPKGLRSNPAGKLRLFWSSGVIQRADWDPMDRQHKKMTKPLVQMAKAGWYTVSWPDGSVKKVRGKAELDKLLNPAPAEE